LPKAGGAYALVLALFSPAFAVSARRTPRLSSVGAILSDQAANRKLPAPPLVAKRGEEAEAQKRQDAQAIRGADFEQLMTGVLAKSLGGEQAMKKACSESDRGPVDIENTVFGDLDGDGLEEAAVTAFSCQAGQTPPDMLAVFHRQPSGEVVPWPLQPKEDSAKFRNTKIPWEYRGPWDIQIDKGRLIVRYLFWDEKAPKCGDSDCTQDFIYQWDGHQLALVELVRNPAVK